MPFVCDLSPWLGFAVDDHWLEENVAWKESANGIRLGRLGRQGDTGLVLYHVPADVGAGGGAQGFLPHTHTGGEAYLVLRGEVFDGEGTYPAGSIVWMEPGSRHSPRTRGDTLLLVLWPAGVEVG